jgi:hypothetical protein
MPIRLVLREEGVRIDGMNILTSSPPLSLRRPVPSSAGWAVSTSKKLDASPVDTKIPKTKAFTALEGGVPSSKCTKWISPGSKSLDVGGK